MNCMIQKKKKKKSEKQSAKIRQIKVQKLPLSPTEQNKKKATMVGLRSSFFLIFSVGAGGAFLGDVPGRLMYRG